jgi:hypothetical protein
VPPQNAITRIEQVARDLGVLAEEIESYAGSDARRTLMYWSEELRSAIDELQGGPHPPAARPLDEKSFGT